MVTFRGFLLMLGLEKAFLSKPQTPKSRFTLLNFFVSEDSEVDGLLFIHLRIQLRSFLHMMPLDSFDKSWQCLQT